jgi:hypothetical protein
MAIKVTVGALRSAAGQCGLLGLLYFAAVQHTDHHIGVSACG